MYGVSCQGNFQGCAVGALCLEPILLCVLHVSISVMYTEVLFSVDASNSRLR
jgi:hypothetical protein